MLFVIPSTTRNCAALIKFTIIYNHTRVLAYAIVFTISTVIQCTTHAGSIGSVQTANPLLYRTSRKWSFCTKVTISLTLTVNNADTGLSGRQQTEVFLLMDSKPW